MGLYADLSATKGKLINYHGRKYMKLRRILAGLWIILLLLAGTCYAENTENPIVARTEYGYVRLNIPSVKKVEYYGRYFIECNYTGHVEYFVYGFPVVEETGTYYCWFEPSNNQVFYFGKKHYDASKEWIPLGDYKKDFSNETSSIYNVIKNSFPQLCEEVASFNKLADEKFGSYLAKAFIADKNKDWEAEFAALMEAYDNGCQSQALIRDLVKSSWNAGELDTAIYWASKRLEVAPSADTYNDRAYAYYITGKNDLALEDAKWATLKDKNNPEYLDTRGCIYYEMGQYNEAIKDFDAALKINDKYAHAYYYRGKCYEAVGKKSDAQSDYKKAKNLNPEIVDSKVWFEKQRSQFMAAKQQRHSQRREKYK